MKFTRFSLLSAFSLLIALQGSLVSENMTIFALLGQQSECSLFYQAIKRVGYQEAFDAVPGGTSKYSAYTPFVVWVPNNTAMEAAGFSLQQLKTITFDRAARKGNEMFVKVKKMLKQHGCNNVAINEGQFENLPKELDRPQDEALIVDKEGKTVKGTSKTVNIVNTDIVGSNGVGHVIDAVLD